MSPFARALVSHLNDSKKRSVVPGFSLDDCCVCVRVSRKEIRGVSKRIGREAAVAQRVEFRCLVRW